MDISSDVVVFEDRITSPNPPYVAKSTHLPLAEGKGQVTNESPSTKLTVPFSEKVRTSQHFSTTNVEVGAH